MNCFYKRPGGAHQLCFIQKDPTFYNFCCQISNANIASQSASSINYPCSYRNAEHSKNRFSKEDDELILHCLQNNCSFEHISMMIRRPARHIREHYKNYLDPRINRTPFTPEEDKTLLRLVDEHGRKWSYFIKSDFQKRTDNDLRNRWNTLMKRKEKIAFVPAICVEENMSEIEPKIMRSNRIQNILL
jgi:hypothetical protein